jgi:hypothetical protein
MTTAYKRSAKLERLTAQGTLIEGEVDGQKVPYFAMPTAELQSDLNDVLEGLIKKQLKKAGWERVCATERRHPFHSELLRERIDELAPLVFVRGESRWHTPTYSWEYLTEESAEKARRSLRRYAASTKQHAIPITKEDADYMVDRGIKENRVCWAAAFGKYRQYLRDPVFWKGTYVGRELCPDGQPPIPDGVPPKPVYISKQAPDLVIGLADAFVNLWVRSGQAA